MLSLHATYDGGRIHFVDFTHLSEIKSPKQVIVTFLDDDNLQDITSDELHLFAQYGGALDFLANKEEDIYSDADLKLKYR